MKANKFNREVISWALYDWGNSAFATTIMAGFFPLFFKEYWSLGHQVSLSTYRLGLANSLASLVLAIAAPILGTIADQSRKRKNFLTFFCLLGCIASGGLYFVGKGQWELAVLFFILGTFGFAGGNIFYDSLITYVCKKSDYDVVSSLGYSLGYLGGGLLFAFNVAMTLHPQFFGLASPEMAVKISFLSVAVWWLIFYFPLLRNVNEDASRKDKPGFHMDLREIFSSLKTTLLKQDKTLLLFLSGYFFYIDGVNTIVKMAVDYGLSLGFKSSNLITALLITQFVGFPAAIAFGYLGKKIGALKGIYIALFSYMVITIFGYYLQNSSHFYMLALAVGLVQGGLQSLSRSYYATMVALEHEAEYFGFFNMVGRFSAVLGPFLVGWVHLKTQNPRLSILVISIFFLLGALFLYLSQRSKGTAKTFPA